MEKRTRSPNYPSLSLPEALEKTRLVYQNQHTHSAPREVIVKSMGYAGISGTSAMAFSALHKYGLLEGRGDEVRLSDRAMHYLSPLSAEERVEAIRAAATSPELFKELAEKFPGQLPSEEVLRNYLIRNGFSPAAVSGVIGSYRETLDYVEREERSAGYVKPADAASTVASEQSVSSDQPTSQQLSPARGIENVPASGERSLGRHDFEDGSFVRIVASGELGTEEALDWIEFLVQAKRRELKMRDGRRIKTSVPSEANRLDDLLG